MQWENDDQTLSFEKKRGTIWNLYYFGWLRLIFTEYSRTDSGDGTPVVVLQDFIDSNYFIQLAEGGAREGNSTETIANEQVFLRGSWKKASDGESPQGN